MDHNDFDNVSWRNDTDSDPSRPTTATTDDDNDNDHSGDRSSPEPSFEPSYGKGLALRSDETQAGRQADAVDLAGIGEGILECIVDQPLKESEGTKDAFISYLVTTHVS